MRGVGGTGVKGSSVCTDDLGEPGPIASASVIVATLTPDSRTGEVALECVGELAWDCVGEGARETTGVMGREGAGVPGKRSRVGSTSAK